MTEASDPLLDDESNASDDTALVERGADALLSAAFANGTAAVFGSTDAAQLAIAKKSADRLVQLKLARYADDGRTELAVTNAGRYWALNGGYLAFLKEDPPGGGGGGRNRNPEFEALRMDYMKLRMNTFWLTFGMSIAGFVISLISIGIALYTGKSLPLR
jgi:hypothetical protein